MSKKVRKSLGEYISQMKTPRPRIRLPSKKWVMPGCRHVRTTSLDKGKGKGQGQGQGQGQGNNNIKDDEAMLADIDRFLFENFKSLFLEDRDDSPNSSHLRLGPIRFDDQSPHNLFTDTTSEPRSSSATSESDQTPLPSDCIVLLSNSDCPAQDFRRSIHSLVEARLSKCGKVDWEFMQEVLFCHMNLNQKQSHKFILSAFVDVVNAMRDPPDTTPLPVMPPRSVRTVRIGREVRKKTKAALTFDFGSP